MSRARSKIRRRDQPSGAAPPVCATPSASFSAKWGDEEHDLFVRLCYDQVVKGNKPNTTLNKEGWNAVYQQFVAHSGKDPVWDLRKLKNHWDAMREDYKNFRKLKSGKTGLGWNVLTKASDEWWKEKIKVARQWKLCSRVELKLWTCGRLQKVMHTKKDTWLRIKDQALDIILQIFIGVMAANMYYEILKKNIIIFILLVEWLLSEHSGCGKIDFLF
ncbi:uncharacterized protein LOC141687522 [Apium graveolens]|uniref:uncharacterized protein LOC141687522 n=1 Tax=Apium graveolens TaxID=4045 RepID=UPI003D7A1556